MWRDGMNCLPTMVQLRTKHLHVSSLCPVCQSEDETILYRLVSSPESTLCWNRVGIGTSSTPDNTFLDWCIISFKALDVEKRCVLAMICWAIWEARNDLVWNKKTGDGAEHWILPQVNSIKINVDTTMFERENGFGFGMVARDSNGFLIEGRTTFLTGQVEPKVAEAMVVREALSWIKDHQWQSTSLETVCLLVVQVLGCTFSMISLFGHVIDDCRRLLALLKNIFVIFKTIS
uniref:RNase H type-1 domain-containing protein n=1 Tax=Cannabis sativa TaxID=3483 RepID=A0A803QA67_CANSA